MIRGKKRCSKKGQITLFIIIGIIMLLSIALIVFIKTQTTVFKPKLPVPTETSPIKNYIEACIQKLGAEGADIIGTTGGYITFPEGLADDRFSYIKFSPLENGKNPYWYYRGERRIPPIERVAQDMNDYITENLKECVENLDIFREQYNIEERGEIKTTTTLGDEGTPIKVVYPITIRDKLGVKITELDEFSVVVPYRIKTAYELAVNIMEAEEKQAKIEDLTIDLIALDNDIPYSDIELRCDKRKWKISEIEDKLKLLLRYNLPLIRIDKTNYEPVPSDMPYLQSHFVWAVTDMKYPDFRASFSYDEAWPMDFYVRPNNGDYIESGMQKGSQAISWLCIQLWKFTYDIRYPVLATITDEKTGFSFSFSFNVIIDHNRANRQASGTSTFEFTPSITESEYCSNPAIPMEVASFDDVDGDHMPLAGVNISFTCLRYTCPYLGTTAYKYGGAQASVVAQFPFCSWGIIRGEKPGYKTGETFAGTEKAGEANVYLIPLKTIKNYRVVKHKAELVNGAWVISENGEQLKAGESATIYIEREGHETSGIYPATELLPLVLLSDGTFDYSLRIYLLDEDSIKGGYLGSWTVERYELSGGTEAVFHVVYADKFADETQQTLFMSDDSLKQFSGYSFLSPELI